jgi:hypothetical protein
MKYNVQYEWRLPFWKGLDPWLFNLAVRGWLPLVWRILFKEKTQ